MERGSSTSNRDAGSTKTLPRRQQTGFANYSPEEPFIVILSRCASSEFRWVSTRIAGNDHKNTAFENHWASVQRVIFKKMYTGNATRLRGRPFGFSRGNGGFQPSKTGCTDGRNPNCRKSV